MKLRLPLLADFYDYTGAARCLEQLARHGWKLTGLGPWLWSFERTEQRDLRYSVVYFPDVLDLDPNPKIELLDYIAMCEAAGWALAARQNQRLIFCTADPNAVPIDTDPAIQVDTIHKVMKKTHVRGYLIVIALAVFYLLRDLGDLGDYGCYFLADPFDIGYLALKAVILLLAVLEIVTYFLWLRQAKSAAKRGAFVSSKKTGWMSLLELTVFPVSLLILLITVNHPAALLPMAGIVVIISVLEVGTYWFGKFLKKQGYDAGSNQIMQVGALTIVLFVVFMLWADVTADYIDEKKHEAAAGYVTDQYGDRRYYNDHDLPLTLEDLGMEEGDTVYDRTLEVTASPLMRITQGLHRPVMFWMEELESLPALTYTLTVAEVSWLREYMKADKEPQPEFYAYDNARVWQAERVLKHKRKGINNYVVFWEERVLEITFSEEPTEEQIEIVTAVMKGGTFE